MSSDWKVLVIKVKEWIEAILGVQFGDGLPHSYLEDMSDGIMMCNLINAMKPGTITRIETSTRQEKKLANITEFLNVCDEIH